MRIVHLSGSDLRGGAARAAYRLHEGLLRLGHDSRMLVWRRSSSDPEVLAYRPSGGWRGRFDRRRRQFRASVRMRPYRSSRPAACEPFQGDDGAAGAELVGQIGPADVVNLHWISGFVDYADVVPRLPRSAVLVWTLHDMNVFTGGCPYDQGCGRFRDRCGRCPQLGSSRDDDLSRRVLERKQRVFQSVLPGLQVVADSEWLAAEARRSSLLARADIQAIHYGLDLDVFAPRPRAVARSVFGLPDGRPVVLFVSDALGNPRKGFESLGEALLRVGRRQPVVLTTIGGGNPSFPLSVEHRHLGRINDDRLLALAYSAADVFVIPSLQEAFGQTALESIACGTPVAGYETGGIPEIVRPGSTGRLAPVGDSAALAEAIRDLLDERDLGGTWVSSCRSIAESEFGLLRQARDYETLYESRMQKGR
jgi:glycosyltransferase involved in cell wall biosynthesis